MTNLSQTLKNELTSDNKNIRFATDVEFDFKAEIVLIRFYQQNKNDLNNNNTKIKCGNGCSIIRFQDILSCHVVDSDSFKFLAIFHYPQIPISSNQNGEHDCLIKRRRRHVTTFRPKLDNEMDDKSLANWLHLWQTQIETNCLGCAMISSPGQMVSRPKRNLLVFINPFSGPGRALQIFQRKVLPVFLESGLDYCIFKTEKALQARDWVRKMNLNEWDGLVIVSGDGLVFEVLNGLCMRNDLLEALKLPIGIIPGGSGNALAVSCCFSQKDSIKFNYATDAAFVIARPIFCQLKLIHVQMSTQNLLSFMGLGWGLLADIDIESEKFRRLLGTTRFVAGGLARWTNLRTYKGRLSFKLAPNCKQYNYMRCKQKISKSCPNLNNNDQCYCSCTGICRATRSVNDDQEQETAQEAEHYFGTEYANLDNNSDGFSATKQSVHNYNYQFSTTDDSLNRKLFRENSTILCQLDEKDFCTPDNQLTNHLSNFDQLKMPALDQPTPNDWVQIDGSFYSIYLVYLSHLASNNPFMPYSCLNDDVMYLTVIRTDRTSRLDLLKFLTSLDSGRHLDSPCLEVYPVVAFRLERFNEDSILTVDGENIKCTGPVQACLSNLKATVMTSHDCSF